ncbi:hypothetical protein CROQUDRAFT_714297 [Cronartium quercuum f. sp. fusiforme G11]|uniref:Uncharacterized protein n=1 Tax=Cronartium quercuum f. sp. fusiforme G11 TaxID=708437 RepID=A0A9P6TEE2_9BASI|nr:hypothetical protein CROQUDRAFT_714297 [Cronartium quercuum f. sp. fusiforme G11]
MFRSAMTMRSLYLYILAFSHVIMAQSQERSGCFNYYLASPPLNVPTKSLEQQTLAPRNIITSRLSSNKLSVRGIQEAESTELTTNDHGHDRRTTLKVVDEAFTIQPRQLNKRFDTPDKPFTSFRLLTVSYAKPLQTCGPYDSNQELGVCLWSGIDGDSKDPGKTGWLGKTLTGNCGKTLFVQRAGQPETMIFAKVVDSCAFPITDHGIGCAQIFLTKKAFDLMKPTQEELQNGAITNLVWDFNTEANMAT